MTLDEIIWWTGAAVIAAGGFAFAAAIVAALLAGGCATIGYWLLKLGWTIVNARHVSAWAKAGRPKWQRVDDLDGYRMVPTDGPWEDIDGLTGDGKGETL